MKKERILVRREECWNADHCDTVEELLQLMKRALGNIGLHKLSEVSLKVADNRDPQFSGCMLKIITITEEFMEEKKE